MHQAGPDRLDQRASGRRRRRRQHDHTITRTDVLLELQLGALGLDRHPVLSGARCQSGRLDGGCELRVAVHQLTERRLVDGTRRALGHLRQLTKAPHHPNQTGSVEHLRRSSQTRRDLSAGKRDGLALDGARIDETLVERRHDRDQAIALDLHWLHLLEAFSDDLCGLAVDFGLDFLLDQQDLSDLTDSLSENPKVFVLLLLTVLRVAHGDSLP